MLLAGSVVGVSIVSLALALYIPLNRTTSKTEFIIASGDGSAKVARLLAEEGLIRSRWLFIFYTVATGQEKNFKAGKYAITSAYNIPTLVKIFASGQALPEGELVTVTEGMNTADIDRLLAEKEVIKPGQLLDYTFKHRSVYGGEGYLFPDSYYFDKDTPVEKVVKTAKDNFDEKTGSLLRNPNAAKVNEAVTVASILEKEVRKQEDMALVAGIIYKRIELGMPLQIDATVAYGVCLPKWLNRTTCNVVQVNLVENIKVDSVYNTYARKGLPPGPISNPGLAAISAALHPTQSGYLYYLSAKDDGRTIFSKTPWEHRANRVKYLK